MIAVLMPAYNAAAYVERAARSILDQTYRDLTFIAVDDGSTDETAEILQRIAAEDPRMTVLQGEHGGGSAAMNLAAKGADRPWLAVMHADDEAEPDRLQRQLAAAEADPRVVVWGTHGRHINAAGETLGLSRFGPESVDAFERDFAAGRPINVLHPSALLRRDVFERIGGYDPGIGNCEDLDLFMRMAHHGPVVTLPCIGVRYRLHAASNTLLHFRRQAGEYRYIMDRRRRELRGEPPFTRDAYLRAEAARPGWRRFNDWRCDAGAHRFRLAGTRAAERRRAACVGCLAFAAALRPAFVVRRLWTQRFSAAARRELHSTASDTPHRPAEPHPVAPGAA